MDSGDQAGSESFINRFDEANPGSWRAMGCTRVLEGILFFALLHNPVDAAINVTLGWDPNPETNVGYKIYHGVASRTYTNMVNVGQATSATISNLVSGTTYYFAVTAYYTSTGLESGPSAEVTYTHLPNTAPTISGIASQTINAGGTTGPIPFVVWDVEAAAAGLTVSGVSSNPLLVPVSNIVFGGGGSNRTVTLSPAAGQTGSAAITVSVSDGQLSSSTPFTLTVNAPPGLPAPWQTADIGGVGAAGSASMSGGLYTVQGAGTISGSADNFRFVYQPLSGDGEIKVRLRSMENTGPNGRIGVIIRESLTSGSEYAFMGISSDGIFRWQRRSKTGGPTSSTTSTLGTPPNVWMRLVRTSNVFYGYKSTDGINWTQVSSRSINMAGNIYMGLAVASGSSTTLNTTTFTNLTVIP